MATILSVRGKEPILGPDCWVADSATIVGEVRMGRECTVWFNAVIRGDVHYIFLGDRVNVQDGAIIHCTYEKAPTTIGNNVSIGHRAIVHGCIIEDNVLIGMGAIVMDNAIIKENAIVAAGSVVLEGTVVESGSIYAGVPAKLVKKASQEHLNQLNQRIAQNYVMYASWYKNE